MQLTDQMKAEIDGIKKYLDGMNPIRKSIKNEMLISMKVLTPKNLNYMAENKEYLGIFKVRLENLLCETDLKEQDHLSRL